MANLHKVISEIRLDAYRQSVNDTDLECLHNYIWNIALSEALYLGIHHFEVALRNSIHEAAKANFNDDYWFDDSSLIQNTRTQGVIQKAKYSLTQAGKPHDADRIVAELHFGFWRTLFFAEYELNLWRPIIRDVFPNSPRRLRQRNLIGSRVHRVKTLRNRIFHHEPIWHWRDLETQHQEVLEMITWMSQPLYALVIKTDRFPEVYNMGLKEIKDKFMNEEVF